MQEIFFPDYERSILNLIVSILKKYQVKSDYASLKELDGPLQHDYTNVVLLIMDGLGENILSNIPDGSISKHRKTTISSVFPSTTTAAIATLLSGLPPAVHGNLAWSLYFKELGRTIDFLPYRDSYTKEPFSCTRLDGKKVLSYPTILDQIQKATQNKVKTIQIYQKEFVLDSASPLTIGVDDFHSLCSGIQFVCNSPEKKFVWAYYDQPDGLIHKYGCYAKQTKAFLTQFESEIKQLAKDLKNTNTLLIITADHGHKNIDKSYDIVKLEKLQECFTMPPFLESRCLSMFVKYEKRVLFEKRFKKMFSDQFVLYTKEAFLQSGLLGKGTLHKKIDDFIGDYIAIATGNSIIKLGTHLLKDTHNKKSTHCGLTQDEMEIPLILFDFKTTS